MKHKLVKRLLIYSLAAAITFTEITGIGAVGNVMIAQATETSDVLNGTSEEKSFDFEAGLDGFAYNDGWDYKYTGTANTSVEHENGMMKLNVDYSADGGEGWSQASFGRWGDISVQGASKLTADVYYNPSLLDGGSFAVKTCLQYDAGDDTYPSVVETSADVDMGNAVDAEALEGYKKATVTLEFDPVTQETCCNLMFMLVGKNTTYNGAVYVDNIKLFAEKTEDIFVDATETPTGAGNVVSVSGNSLLTKDSEGGEVLTDISDSISLVDSNATADTKAVYAYLKAMGSSKSVIFGHQNDTWRKAGAAELSNSDTVDVTGSVSGVIGIDTLSLTGNEYSASEYNKANGASLPETPAGNVEAAALLTNQNLADGAIITLSAHMPNFSIVKEREGYTEGDPSYAKYDFSGYSPNTVSGDVMNEILPDGKYNEVYNAYLDMIADYASQVNGTILFRPFHENTGSWFWWGKAYCDAQTYKNVYKYTVEYLRDGKNVHNMLYVYGPGSEAASVAEYGERYPGDNYVDMVGFDMYHSAPTENDTWFDSFKTELGIVETFAKEHNKLIGVTETGVANAADKGDNQTALHKTGNAQLDWYTKMLNAVSDTEASYFLVWANFSERDGFYTPYVKSVSDTGVLHGHEMMDEFIKFYNDPRSVFAVNQKTVLTGLADKINVTVTEGETSANGYFTAPVSGKRILTETTFYANVNGLSEGEKVFFVCINGDRKVELEASGTNNRRFSAKLSEESLASLGEGVGKVELRVGDTVLDDINATFNIPEPAEDPYKIDDFEDYFGVDSMLQKKWASNKSTGSVIDITLTSEEGKFYSGNYGLKFSYTESGASNDAGWAGATISKEVDWSDCNALQFWTIPDGNNQKVVIQITAGGKEYEVYLNQYPEYSSTTDPILMTIPFKDFVDRDGDGPEGGLESLKDKVQSFGLWVNLITDEQVTVSGDLYYDNITAVNTNKKPSEDEGNKPDPTPTQPAKPTQPTKPTKPAGDVTQTPQAKPAGTTMQDEKAVYTVTDQENKTVAYSAPADKKAKSVTIPKEVTIDGVTYQVAEIAAKAFYKCKKLQKVTIPENITTIGANAFASCTSLKKITIGKDVTTIGKGAFKGDKNLKSIVIKSKSLKKVGSSAFKGINKKATIKVPSSKVKAYKKLLKKKGQASTVQIKK